MKTLKGKITISRRHNSRTGDSINIAVVDELSTTEFLDLTMILEDFAQAVTGLSRVDCTFEFRPDVVGMVREHKTVEVPLGGREYVMEELKAAKAKKLLAPYEVNGWKGDTSDLFNHHRRHGDFATVTFHRYVPAAASGGPGE